MLWVRTAQQRSHTIRSEDVKASQCLFISQRGPAGVTCFSTFFLFFCKRNSLFSFETVLSLVVRQAFAHHGYTTSGADNIDCTDPRSRGLSRTTRSQQIRRQAPHLRVRRPGSQLRIPDCNWNKESHQPYIIETAFYKPFTFWDWQGIKNTRDDGDRRKRRLFWEREQAFRKNGK